MSEYLISRPLLDSTLGIYASLLPEVYKRFLESKVNLNETTLEAAAKAKCKMAMVFAKAAAELEHEMKRTT